MDRLTNEHSQVLCLPEILQHIFAYMEDKDVARSHLVNKHFNHHLPRFHQTNYNNKHFMVSVDDPVKLDLDIAVKSATSMKIELTWMDQGWGNKKGTFLIKEIKLDEDGKSFLTSTIQPFDVAGHRRSVNETEFKFEEEIHGLEFRVIVGGGGGHQLNIEKLKILMTYLPHSEL
ncbi:urease subunit alpha [Acrasis kona]|uniref:Urease subunit alpha n=1 Tax=Acrasis kona TaxID=1008807 RepID=A0AAW2ZJF1_9EUKA